VAVSRARLLSVLAALMVEDNFVGLWGFGRLNNMAALGVHMPTSIRPLISRESTGDFRCCRTEDREVRSSGLGGLAHRRSPHERKQVS
jgi:hypothetical protein